MRYYVWRAKIASADDGLFGRDVREGSVKDGPLCVGGWMNHSQTQGIVEEDLVWEEIQKFIFGMLILRWLWNRQEVFLKGEWICTSRAEERSHLEIHYCESSCIGAN